MPHCRAQTSNRQIPCYSDPAGRVKTHGIDATLYTVSRDADQWHLSYLWRADGATYVVSEHVAPPFSFAQVKRNVTRVLRSLVLVPPVGVKLTRKQVLAGAAVGALGAAGAYELVDQLAGSSPPRAAAGPLPPEQHVLDGVRTITDNGVEVAVPPLHHQVVTARVRVDAADLPDAARTLEDALAGLERRYAPDAGGTRRDRGVGTAVLRPPRAGARGDEHAPHDVARTQGGAAAGAKRFSSDPDATVLEENDVAVLLRSDHLEHIADASKTIFDELDLFDVTSIRKGFAGGGFDGGAGLPKQMALAAGVPGAELIPDGAELFLGFTSTQAQGLGPRKIVELRDARLRRPAVAATSAAARTCTSRTSASSSTRGTSSSTSTTASTRCSARAFACARARRPCAQGPEDVVDARRRSRAASRRIGSSVTARRSRRRRACRPITSRPTGRVYRKGTAIPHRADFNTLDNPFFWSARSGGRRDERAAVGRRALRRLQSDERRLRAHAERDGRRLPGRRAS